MLRIIGGAWRGRRLRFPAIDEIRPTPDRVRETLFNWLGTRVQAARCLDLFAGSGALGLEALSRGAAQAVFVEQAAEAVRELERGPTQWAPGKRRRSARMRSSMLRDTQASRAVRHRFPRPALRCEPAAAAARCSSGGWLAPMP